MAKNEEVNVTSNIVLTSKGIAFLQDKYGPCDCGGQLNAARRKTGKACEAYQDVERLEEGLIGALIKIHGLEAAEIYTNKYALHINEMKRHLQEEIDMTFRSF